MLHASPLGWAHVLPGYGGFRVLTSAILTHSFSRAGPPLIALASLAGATAVATFVFRHYLRTAGRARSRPGTQLPGAAATGEVERPTCPRPKVSTPRGYTNAF